MISRITHTQVSENIDTADPAVVGSESWNRDHVIFLSAILDALDKMALTGTQIFYTTTDGVYKKDITAYMLDLLGQSDQNGLLSFIPAQLANENLTAESGLAGAADKVSYYTGPGAKALTDLSTFVRTVLGAANAATFRSGIGAVNVAGDTMTGNLAMATHKVTGLGAPSDTTDAATKAYVDALATLVSGALVFKGAWDASAGTFPGAAVAQTGWFYKVSVAGTVNGVVFYVGDDVYAIVNNASTSTYANNWLKIQGAMTLAEIQAAIGFTFGSLAALSAVTASLISDASANGRSLITAANYAAMKTLLAVAVADITDATANGRSLISAANYAAMKTLLAVAVADITDATANGRSLISAANYAAMKTLLAIAVSDVSGAAPLASPSFSGSPTAPNQAAGDSSGKIANTKYADDAIALAMSISGAVPRSYLAGLALSVAGGSATFNIAAGQATDRTNARAMALTSAYTKTTSAWALGSGNGSLDTGTIANSTWYHVYEIMRPDTGVVDILISLNATSPTLPTNYTLFRRIGAMLTDGSAHWTAFTQIGDQFNWLTAVNSITTTTLGAAPVYFTTAVPPGFNIIAKLRGFVQSPAAGVIVYSPTESAVWNSPAGNASVYANTASAVGAGHFDVVTDTSARALVVASVASTSFTAVTYAYIDRRGRDD